jgi:hypothetical protein
LRDSDVPEEMLIVTHDAQRTRMPAACHSRISNFRSAFFFGEAGNGATDLAHPDLGGVGMGTQYEMPNLLIEFDRKIFASDLRIARMRRKR